MSGSRMFIGAFFASIGSVALSSMVQQMLPTSTEPPSRGMTRWEFYERATAHNERARSASMENYHREVERATFWRRVTGGWFGNPRTIKAEPITLANPHLSEHWLENVREQPSR